MTVTCRIAWDYCLLIGQRYRRRVRQAVLYLGLPPVRMESSVDLGETKSAHTLIDIREMDARGLMASGRTGDLALAMLARGGADQLLEITKRAVELKGPDRRRALSQLVLLSGLRRLTGRLKMELKAMDATTDITKNEIVQDTTVHICFEECLS